MFSAIKATTAVEPTKVSKNINKVYFFPRYF